MSLFFFKICSTAFLEIIYFQPHTIRFDLSQLLLEMFSRLYLQSVLSAVLCIDNDICSLLKICNYCVSTRDEIMSWQSISTTPLVMERVLEIPICWYLVDTSLKTLVKRSPVDTFVDTSDLAYPILPNKWMYQQGA